MRKKHRTMNRFCSVILALAMLAGSVFSGSARIEDRPKIPGDYDGLNILNDYDPEKDGYFGYLPVRYYLDPLDAANSEATDKDLPIIVWDGKIYAAAEDLGRIAGLKVTEAADKIKFEWKERHLAVTRDSTAASFILGPCKKGQRPYISEQITLSAAPFRGTGMQIYVPVTDICGIMGVNLLFQTDRYFFNPPQEDVYDVLASFCGDSLESCMFMYEADENALKKAEVSSRTVLTLDGMIGGEYDKYIYTALRVMCSIEYITQYMPDKYIWNRVVEKRGPERSDIDKQYWDSILAESLIKELWFASENETIATAEKTADVMAAEIGALFYDDTLAFLKDAQTDYFEVLIEQLQSANAQSQYMMSARTYVKYFEMLKRYESQIKEIRSTLDKVGKVLGGVSEFLTAAKTGLAAVNDLAAFYGRDKVMDDALKIFLNYKGYNYLSFGAVTKMREEYKSYTAAPGSYALAKAMLDTATEDLISTAMGAASLVASCYKIFTSMSPEYQATLDSMVAYQTSLLSIAMQKEAHLTAYTGILVNDRDIHTELRGSFLDKEIMQAYLYFKSCAVTRELVQKAFEYQDPLLDDLYQKLTFLEQTYGFTEDGRPASYAERFAACTEGLDERIISEAVISLYVTVSGKVLTFGDNKPVPNGIAQVTEHGLQRVYFEADGAGEYKDIHIPIFWPAPGITEFEKEFDISLYFFSENRKIEGDDTKVFPFEAKGSVETDDAHLLWKGSLEAVVTDKESGEKIENAEFLLEHTDPGVYEPYGIRTVFGGEGDAFGNVLQDSLPPGTYRAVFSKEGYESREMEIRIESGEVTRLPEPVELEKKTAWLLVTKDYQDIAHDGLWSKRLNYSYDKNARLIEIGDLSAASDYRYNEYDGSGRLIQQIRGSSGSTWYAERYTYDGEGRLERTDDFLLDYEGVQSGEDWKTKTLKKNGWKIYYYEGDLLVKIDHYSKDGAFLYGNVYQYDESGKMTYDIEVDEEGNQLVSDLGKRYKTTYEYDEKGRLSKETYIGSRVITTTYEYDEEDRLVKETNLYTGYVTLYTYDENGNLAREESYSGMGKTLASRTLYYYKLFPFEEE